VTVTQINREDVVEWSKLETDIADQLIRLYELTASISCKNKVVVELGTRRGNSTRALLAAVNDSGGHLYSVDIGKCGHALSALGRESNWTFTRGDDLEVIKQWNLPIDHLFIDTSHTYEHTLAELREWGGWVKAHGIISLHDIHYRKTPGVMEAIRKYLSENPSFEFTEYSGSNGLGVIIKLLFT
jgi:predicted O-methyltransferase YrrM